MTSSLASRFFRRTLLQVNEVLSLHSVGSRRSRPCSVLIRHRAASGRAQDIRYSSRQNLGGGSPASVGWVAGKFGFRSYAILLCGAILWAELKRFKSFNLCLLRGLYRRGQRFESDPNLRVQNLKNICDPGAAWLDNPVFPNRLGW